MAIDKEPRILYVDTSAWVCDTLRYVYSTEHGHPLITALHEKECMRLALQHTPQAIVLNHDPPILDGPSCYRQIRAEESLEHTAILGVDFPEPLRTTLDGLLQKPFSSTRFLEELDKAILTRIEKIDKHR